LLSFLVDLFVLFALVSLVALVVKQRRAGGIKLNLVFLVIVGLLLLSVFSMGKAIAIMFGVIVLLSLFISMLLTRRTT
jgi:lipopolysaccharide export LptBFGC system permease protein LptF